MKINPINNIQTKFGKQKVVENEYNNNNKNNNKNILNQQNVKLFSILYISYTICAFDKISDGFNNLTKTQKVGRIAKWAAIISACSSLLVAVSSFSVTDFIQKLLSKPKEDKKQK